MSEVVSNADKKSPQSEVEVDQSNRFWKKNLNIPVKADYTLKEASTILGKKITLKTRGIWKFEKNKKIYVSYCAMYQYWQKQQLYTKEI